MRMHTGKTLTKNILYILILNHSSLPDKLLYIIVSILIKYRRQKI